VRWTACMLTASLAFVMSSVGFLSVGRCCSPWPLSPLTRINGTPLIRPHLPPLVNRQIATILYSTRTAAVFAAVSVIRRTVWHIDTMRWS
jgi:hypothetical protein